MNNEGVIKSEITPFLPQSTLPEPPAASPIVSVVSHATRLLHIVDWLPTLLALSDKQAELPDGLDGQDIWPLLLDPGSELNLKPIYITGAGEAALRVGDWKLIELRTGATELYNLREDPGEENNLADIESHRRDELISLLRRQQEKDGAAVHRLNSNGTETK